MNRWPRQHVPRIDWSNPLTRGLVSCVVAVSGRIVDLANPARTFTVAGKSSGRGQRGRHVQATLSGSEHLIPSPAVQTSGGDWTYHVLSRFPANAPSFSMVAANPSGAYYSFGYVSGGELIVWSGGNQAFSPALTMPTSGWSTLSVSGNATANQLRGMIDGGAVGTITTTIAQDMTSLLGDSSLASRGWPDTAAMLVYNRTQSDAEMRRLARDIWQIFEPVRRSVPLVAPSTVNSYTLAADPGAFALAGSSAALKVARNLAAAPGSFTLTGTMASLKVSRRLGASAGSFAFAGAAPNLTASRKLSAAPGSFALTGSAAALKLSRRMAAGGGAFTLTGAAAALPVARRLSAAPGAIALTGGDVNFSLQSQHVLAAGPGAFALNGGEAVLRVARRIVAQGGSLALAGGVATLRIDRRLPALPGSFSVAGGGAALRIDRRLVAEGGAATLAGGNVNFAVDHNADLTVRDDRLIIGFRRDRVLSGFARHRILGAA